MSQKQLYLAAMENNMKSCLNLQATPRGQQAETSQTSRLSSLIKRKACRKDNESIKLNMKKSESNNVIIDESILNVAINRFNKSDTDKRAKRVFVSKESSNQKGYSKHNNYQMKLIFLQLLAVFTLTFIVISCNAEPIPAGSSAVVQANNNSGGARSATTKALRGPPMNGSIFGKRSLMPSGNKQAKKSDSTSNDYLRQNDNIEQYNDVITDIIEDFLAKNTDAEPEESSRAFCRMIVYECTQYLAKSRKSSTLSGRRRNNQILKPSYRRLR